jgi:hypothetical protein
VPVLVSQTFECKDGFGVSNEDLGSSHLPFISRDVIVLENLS